MTSLRFATRLHARASPRNSPQQQYLPQRDKRGAVNEDGALSSRLASPSSVYLSLLGPVHGTRLPALTGTNSRCSARYSPMKSATENTPETCGCPSSV